MKVLAGANSSRSTITSFLFYAPMRLLSLELIKTARDIITSMNNQINELYQLLTSVKHCIAFTGAGISTL